MTFDPSIFTKSTSKVVPLESDTHSTRPGLDLHITRTELQNLSDRDFGTFISKSLEKLRSKTPSTQFDGHVLLHKALEAINEEPRKHAKKIDHLSRVCENEIKILLRDPKLRMNEFLALPRPYLFFLRNQAPGSFNWEFGTRLHRTDEERRKLDRLDPELKLIGSNLGDLQQYLTDLIDKFHSINQNKLEFSERSFFSAIKEINTEPSLLIKKFDRNKLAELITGDKLICRSYLRVLFDELRTRLSETDDSDVLKQRLVSLKEMLEILKTAEKSPSTSREIINEFYRQCRIEYDWEYNRILSITELPYSENEEIEWKHHVLSSRCFHFKIRPIMLWYCLHNEAKLVGNKNIEKRIEDPGSPQWHLRQQVLHKDLEEIFLDGKEMFLQEYKISHLIDALILEIKKIKGFQEKQPTLKHDNEMKVKDMP